MLCLIDLTFLSDIRLTVRRRAQAGPRARAAARIAPDQEARRRRPVALSDLRRPRFARGEALARHRPEDHRREEPP